MNFKKATDELFARVTHDDLAKALDSSVPAIRQARLAEGTQAHRSPPPDWERAVLRLAERQSKHFDRLAAKLR